jgi:AraC-like DNA-binding protein
MSVAGMSKDDMPITGYVPLPEADALLGTVRIDVVFLDGKWLDKSWNYELCSPFWRLYVNRGTGAVVELDGHSMSLNAGVVYLLPAGLRFRTRLEKNVTRVWQDYVHFDVTGFPPALLRMLFPSPVRLPMTKAIKASLMAWLEQPVHSGSADLAQRLRTLALAYTSFAAACSQATAEGRAAWVAWLALPRIVAPALRKIEESLDTAPTNLELARECGLGVRQFLRRFHTAVGLSPGQYALERRVALAADALARGDESMEAIAGRLGFADRFHFSKTFKSRVGVPPAAYRSMHRAKLEEKRG